MHEPAKRRGSGWRRPFKSLGSRMKSRRSMTDSSKVALLGRRPVVADSDNESEEEPVTALYVPSTIISVEHVPQVKLEETNPAGPALYEAKEMDAGSESSKREKTTELVKDEAQVLYSSRESVSLRSIGSHSRTSRSNDSSPASGVFMISSQSGSDDEDEYNSLTDGTALLANSNTGAYDCEKIIQDDGDERAEPAMPDSDIMDQASTTSTSMEDKSVSNTDKSAAQRMAKTSSYFSDRSERDARPDSSLCGHASQGHKVQVGSVRQSVSDSSTSSEDLSNGNNSMLDVLSIKQRSLASARARTARTENGNYDDEPAVTIGRYRSSSSRYLPSSPPISTDEKDARSNTMEVDKEEYNHVGQADDIIETHDEAFDSAEVAKALAKLDDSKNDVVWMSIKDEEGTSKNKDERRNLVRSALKHLRASFADGQKQTAQRARQDESVADEDQQDVNVAVSDEDEIVEMEILRSEGDHLEETDKNEPQEQAIALETVHKDFKKEEKSKSKSLRTSSVLDLALRLNKYRKSRHFPALSPGAKVDELPEGWAGEVSVSVDDDVTHTSSKGAHIECEYTNRSGEDGTSQLSGALKVPLSPMPKYTATATLPSISTVAEEVGEVSSEDDGDVDADDDLIDDKWACQVNQSSEMLDRLDGVKTQARKVSAVLPSGDIETGASPSPLDSNKNDIFHKVKKARSLKELNRAIANSLTQECAQIVDNSESCDTERAENFKFNFDESAVPTDPADKEKENEAQSEVEDEQEDDDVPLTRGRGKQKRKRRFSFGKSGFRSRSRSRSKSRRDRSNSSARSFKLNQDTDLDKVFAATDDLPSMRQVLSKAADERSHEATKEPKLVTYVDTEEIASDTKQFPLTGIEEAFARAARRQALSLDGEHEEPLREELLFENPFQDGRVAGAPKSREVTIHIGQTYDDSLLDVQTEYVTETAEGVISGKKDLKNTSRRRTIEAELAHLLKGIILGADKSKMGEDNGLHSKKARKKWRKVFSLLRNREKEKQGFGVRGHITKEDETTYEGTETAESVNSASDAGTVNRTAAILAINEAKSLVREQDAKARRRDEEIALLKDHAPRGYLVCSNLIHDYDAQIKSFDDLENTSALEDEDDSEDVSDPSDIAPYDEDDTEESDDDVKGAKLQIRKLRQEMKRAADQLSGRAFDGFLQGFDEELWVKNEKDEDGRLYVQTKETSDGTEIKLTRKKSRVLEMLEQWEQVEQEEQFKPSVVDSPESDTEDDDDDDDDEDEEEDLVEETSDISGDTEVDSISEASSLDAAAHDLARDFPLLIRTLMMVQQIGRDVHDEMSAVSREMQSVVGARAPTPTPSDNDLEPEEDCEDDGTIFSDVSEGLDHMQKESCGRAFCRPT